MNYSQKLVSELDTIHIKNDEKRFLASWYIFTILFAVVIALTL